MFNTVHAFDALHFSVTALTTGFGDITLPGKVGRLAPAGEVSLHADQRP